MTNETKVDLRVIKTHKSIRNALIELLEHTPFEKISVQDIIELALVNRSTFYKYYSGKSDLAGKMIADFKNEYATFLKRRFDGDDLPQLLAEMPKMVFELRRNMLALWKIDTKRHHLYRDMFEMIRLKFIDHVKQNGGTGDIEYQGHIIATIALTSVKYHLERNQLVDFSKLHLAIAQALEVMKHPEK